MEQLTNEDLRQWAQAYIKCYETDIHRTQKDLPEIPETLHSEISQITDALKKAYSEGKEQRTFRGIKGEEITLNLKPLFEAEGHEDEVTHNIRYVGEAGKRFTSTIDDLTLQTYVCRLFLYSRGG